MIPGAPTTALGFRVWAQRKNQRHDDGGRQSRGRDTDGPIGMIGDHAARDQRETTRTGHARIEQREATADIAFRCQVRDSGRNRRNALLVRSRVPSSCLVPGRP